MSHRFKKYSSSQHKILGTLEKNSFQDEGKKTISPNQSSSSKHEANQYPKKPKNPTHGKNAKTTNDSSDNNYERITHSIKPGQKLSKRPKLDIAQMFKQTKRLIK